MTRKKTADARIHLFFITHLTNSALGLFLGLLRSLFPVTSVAAEVLLSAGESPEPLVALHAPERAKENQRDQALKETAAMGAVNVVTSANGTFHPAWTFWNEQSRGEEFTRRERARRQASARPSPHRTAESLTPPPGGFCYHQNSKISPLKTREHCGQSETTAALLPLCVQNGTFHRERIAP